MKKAFTLIELLVVIAIIAILAAILFPVFAQARTAAKKTAAISNQKQISLGIMMYLGDNDDTYARRAGCELNSSMNPALNTGTTMRCTGASFAHNMNWITWQKYYRPYVKSIELYDHPLRQKDSNDWNVNGQFLNSFVTNLGLTGAGLDAFNSVPYFGGTSSGVPQPSNAMLLMELPHIYSVPLVVVEGTAVPGAGGVSFQTSYPLPIREYWRSIIYKTTGGNNCTPATPLVKDRIAVGAVDGFVVGFADGSAKFVSSDKFLSQCPSASEYGIPFPAPIGGLGSNCRSRTTNAYRYNGAAPNTSINYPFWGLGN